MKENFLKGELVDEGIIIKLLKNRLSEKDCAIQGYILEGYPKNATQLEYLKDLKI
jgi:adenylate kinase